MTLPNVLTVLLALLSLYVILLYNKIVRYRVEADNAFFQIDVQLKRRYELIPNLVETVKGYMQHEKETLQKVVEARARAMGASHLDDRLKAEGDIAAGLGRLLAVWERYPDLKADRHALQLQEELVTTENRIAYCRGYYNDIGANYNTLIRQFPSNLLAKMMGCRPREYFQAGEDSRSVPSVEFRCDQANEK